VILGLGEDGHTVSLFADNTPAILEKKRWVVAVNQPLAKPPGKRLTLTLPVINQARNVLFFTIGNEKAKLAEKIFHEEKKTLPAGLVEPLNGKTFWFTTQL
jgi:6-phosphogluconolactonase